MRGRRGSAAGVVAVGVGVLALASGCGGAGSTQERVGASPSGSETAEATVAAAQRPHTVSPSDLADVPVLTKATGAIADLSQQRCNVGPGRQSARASVTSSVDVSATYLVTVSWTTATGDVLARGFDRIPGVEAGQHHNVLITTSVPAGAVRCVWGVQRAAA